MKKSRFRLSCIRSGNVVRVPLSVSTAIPCDFATHLQESDELVIRGVDGIAFPVVRMSMQQPFGDDSVELNMTDFGYHSGQGLKRYIRVEAVLSPEQVNLQASIDLIHTWSHRASAAINQGGTENAMFWLETIKNRIAEIDGSH